MTPSVPLGLPALTASLTAAVGAFVAYQAYRGYRRNDSRPMLYLCVGIALLTTVPVLVRQALTLTQVTGPAGAQFAVLGASVCGLVAVLYSFTGA